MRLRRHFAKICVTSIFGVLLCRRLSIQSNLAVDAHQRKLLHIRKLTTRSCFSRELGSFQQHPLIFGRKDRLNAAALVKKRHKNRETVRKNNIKSADLTDLSKYLENKKKIVILKIYILLYFNKISEILY